MLSSEYSWTKEYILTRVYPDDLMILGEKITRRLLDKLIMDVRIAHNPHMEEAKAKELIEELIDQRRRLLGVEVNTAPLDRAALDALKSQFKGDPAKKGRTAIAVK